MERASALLGMVPQYKLGYAIAYLQGLIADITAAQEDIPNAETIAAMQEVNEMIRTGSGQRFQGTAEDFFAMLDAEDEEDAYYFGN